MTKMFRIKEELGCLGGGGGGLFVWRLGDLQMVLSSVYVFGPACSCVLLCSLLYSSVL